MQVPDSSVCGHALVEVSHPQQMAAKDDLGRRGEDLAAQFLVDAGYTVIDRNWRCPRGEIDLVARDGEDTVFVEVKTRSSTAFGHPFEAITAQKLARIRGLAIAWCEAHPVHRGAHGSRKVVSTGETRSGAVLQGAARSGTIRSGTIRIDAISVIVPAGAVPVIEHLRRVF